MATQQSEYGLFGPTPEQLDEVQRQQSEQAAANYAQMSPQARSDAAMYRAGGMLMKPVMGALGYENKAEAKAKKIQDITGQYDTSTAEGLLQASAAFNKAGMSNEAMLAAQKARELKKEEEASLYAKNKDDRAERELTDVKIAKVTNDLQYKKDQLAANIQRWASDATNDTLSIEQRREASKLANQTKLELERMDNEAKAKGIVLRASYGQGGKIDEPKINFSKMKDSDKWRVVKEQGSDRAVLDKSISQKSEVASLVKRLINHPGFDSITGYSALTNFAALPGSDAKGALSVLEALKSKVATLGRAFASESGKLGNMAVKEWEIVANDVANLDPKSPEFKNEVLRVMDAAENAEKRLRSNYEDTYSIYEGLNPALSAKTLPPLKPYDVNGGKKPSTTTSTPTANTRKTKSGITYTVEP